jgi:hypothetical protein
MLARMDQLNSRLRGDLPHPLRIGIGIHFGEAIVGAMGANHLNYRPSGKHVRASGTAEICGFERYSTSRCETGGHHSLHKSALTRLAYTRG